MTRWATVQVMDEQVSRIGRGVPTPPPKHPRSRVPLRLWLFGGAFGAVLAFLGTTYVIEQSRAVRPTAAVQTPSTAGAVNVEAACVLLVPVMTTGANLVMAVVDRPDGSTVDWRRLDETVSDLQTVKPIAPVEMRDDIQSQIDSLVELQMRHEGTWQGNATVDLTDFRASGLRIGTRCAQYAS